MHLFPEISIKLLIIQHITQLCYTYTIIIQHYIDDINSAQRKNLFHNL